MDPASLIPSPDAIPVHWLWLQLPLTVTTFLHLVAMNVVLGLSCIGLTIAVKGDPECVPLRDAIARTFPFTIAFAINFGVAPLLFLQTLYGQFFYTSSILMGSYWLAIVPLLIITYGAAYIAYFNDDSFGRGPLFIGIATLFLLIVAFLFTNNISLMQMPTSWVEYFTNRSGWQINTADPTLVPRYLHFAASGVAMGGMAIAVYYEVLHRRGNVRDERWIRLGCQWFSLATIINFGVGVWFFGSLPLAAHDPATVVGIVFVILLIGSVFTTIKALVNAQFYRVFPAAAWALITVFLMTLDRDLLRIATLKPYFRLSDLPVVSQYSPLLLFLFVVFGAVVLIRWMLTVVWRMDKEVRS